RNVYLPAASNIEVPPREPPNAHLPAALFEITNTLEGKWKGGMESFSRAKACNPWNITISGLLSTVSSSNLV
ncbi:MAG: GUN4 domain-containing protein, partial [Microcystis sp. M53600_WE12]|nr:GUN4 domain-containing protein [Microcystis sp. M53600_WE12]